MDQLQYSLKGLRHHHSIFADETDYYVVFRIEGGMLHHDGVCLSVCLSVCLFILFGPEGPQRKLTETSNLMKMSPCRISQLMSTFPGSQGHTRQLNFEFLIGSALIPTRKIFSGDSTMWMWDFPSTAIRNHRCKKNVHTKIKTLKK